MVYFLNGIVIPSAMLTVTVSLHLLFALLTYEWIAFVKNKAIFSSKWSIAVEKVETKIYTW